MKNMKKISEEWVFSQRDNEKHRLNWAKDNPELDIEAREKLKEKIIKFNTKIGNTMDLKKEYPTLFSSEISSNMKNK